MSAPDRRDMIRVQGNKEYLPVPARVQWMRGDHADWGIDTAVIKIDWEAGYAVMRAEVRDETGRIIGAGTKTETRKGFGDFVEKAETGAVGRALARAGYGTEDALDLEDDRFADAPVEQERGRGAGAPASSPSDPAPQPEYRRDELRDLIQSEGLKWGDVRVLMAAVGISEEHPATNEQIDALIDGIKSRNEPPGTPPGVSDSGPTDGPEVAPSASGPPPKPGTDEYKALAVQDKANARAYWSNPPEQESLAELMGAPA